MAARILLVDDDILLSTLIADWLAESGCAPVGPARTPDDALALIGAEGQNLDAALLDVTLAGAPSYPVAEALALQGVPFAFVTGRERGEIDAAWRDAPMLQKPFSLVQLNGFVARLLNSRQS